MTNEELYRAFHKADGEYQSKFLEIYENLKIDDHSVRSILAKNEVRLRFPKIWEEWAKAHEEWEVANLHMNERLVVAHENMGFKTYSDKLTN